MKKLVGKISACFTALAIAFSGLIPADAAQTVEGRLITVGGKTVTRSMKIEDVKKLFGEPELVTSSYWGGYAYTFYGENYSDYLYLETYLDGTIASYGSVSPGFETNTYSHGDKIDNYVRVGCEAADSSNILYGAIYYTSYHSDAYEVFSSNLTENNRSISQHAVLMWNAVSYLYGDNTPTYFDEQVFNIGAQLADNSDDLYEYCTSTGQSSYYQLMNKGIVNFSEYSYPNPLEFARLGKNYNCKNGNAIGFMYYPSGNGRYEVLNGFASSQLLSDWKPVSYTDREKQLLETSRKYYAESVNDYNSAESYYEIEPSYDSAETITGGKLSDGIARGAVGYLNAVRTAGGLNPLEYSEELSENAQCKSTYTVFLSQNGVSNPSPHNPPQVEGISDEYYAKCLSGAGENLFMCGIISTDIIGSISNALDDSYGTGQYYSRGHRYNLLDPGWKYIGVGNTLQQGCHKMSGSQDYDVDVVSWPANGVTISESGFTPSGMWTCRFYNGLKPAENTIITVKCLNSGEVWKIDPANLLDSQDFNVSGTLISYRDNSIAFKTGGVYEITYEHLRDASGGDAAYSYRTVYENAYISSEGESDVQSIKLSAGTLKIAVETTRKITAEIVPESADNKRIYFTSDNPSVADVNECGEITAKSLGTAVITAASESGNISAECVVTVVSDPSQADPLPGIKLPEINTANPGGDSQQDPPKEQNPDGDNGNNDRNDPPDTGFWGSVQNKPHVVINNFPSKKKPKVGKAKIRSAKKKKNSKILTVLLSGKVSKASGYQVKVYTSKKRAVKNKKAVVTVLKRRNLKKLTVKNRKLKNKKILYVKVRAYKKTAGNKKYGAWSSIKKVKR